MRIPEFLFPLINAVVRTILCSPAHGLLSSSVLLLRTTGRRTGRPLAIPVRYLRQGDAVYLSTSDDTGWWRNVQANPDVTLRIRGREVSYRASLIRESDAVREHLRRLIAAFPQDAVYHQIAVDRNGAPDEEQLEAALGSAIVILATATEHERDES